jgi:acetylornithine deacetylase/succinyl-diaminopimelate desuccinylase-like protein
LRTGSDAGIEIFVESGVRLRGDFSIALTIDEEGTSSGRWLFEALSS